MYYELQVRSDNDPWYRVSLGLFSDKVTAVASAYNVAPRDACIMYREHGIELEQCILRNNKPGQDEIYLILAIYPFSVRDTQVLIHSEPLPPRQEEKKEAEYTPYPDDDDDEDEPWPDDEDEGEPDYSQWYDRNHGDSEIPDNYPEAVDPETFAPTDYDDDDDYAIGWLESAIDEVNYEQDHP